MSDRHVVWAANKDDYSGDQIAAIFSTREKAQAWVEAHGEPARKAICGWCGGKGTTNELIISLYGLLVPRPCGICNGLGYRIIAAVPGSEIYSIDEFPFDPPPESQP